MKKLTLSLLFFGLFTIAFAQRSITCDVTLNGSGGPFNLSVGNTYTFNTSTVINGFYTWSVSGGLSIVGSRNGSSVQVQATGCGTATICITKSGDGRGVCCECFTVNVSGCEPECPLISTVQFLNNPNVPNVWCCDYAQNWLQVDFSPSNANAFYTVTFTATPGGTPLAQYTNVAGGYQLGWINGIYISNQNPPPCGEYWIFIQNECNPDDVLGFPFQVVQCGTGKPAGIPQLAQQVKMEAFPNPSNAGNITVKLTGLTGDQKKQTNKLTFNLVNIGSSKEVQEWTVNAVSDQVTLSTREVPKGVYFLYTKIGSQNIGTKVIIR